MDITDKKIRSTNLNKQNAIMNEALYNNHELKKGHHHYNDSRNFGRKLNGYDPNKAIPDQEQITNDEGDYDEIDDLDDDFHSPRDLEHDDDQEDLNDEFDNPKDVDDDFTETDKDLEDIDEDDDELEDDLEEDEIEEEDSGDTYPDNDPRKF
ncbi:MAG: hypothetical protein ABIP27_04020 [Flavobacterium circumlabens]|uniref:DNA primase n=1 Tax=Flavobacterium circumlabens TaxID=2133765 RepID=A0ABY2B1T9_9FLAO|nr:hypothetical protein [Flavobacterium circumlabens]TCN59813.1 hypothetical protein EV142_102433 [Flavobacterium circumlabens]